MSDRAGRQDERVAWSTSEPVPAPLAPETAASVDPLEQRLVTGLAKIGLATRHRAWAEAEGRGLTPTQGQILALLRARGETGMRLSELADALAVRAPTATLAVQALERKGLVRKARGAGDGRVRTITLTEAGAAEVARAAGWADFLLTAIDALTPAEQEVFLRGLLTMIRALQRRGEIPVSRMCLTCRFFRPHAHDDPAQPHHCAFVDAPFGDGQLRLECAGHQPAPPAQADATWEQFTTRG